MTHSKCPTCQNLIRSGVNQILTGRKNGEIKMVEEVR